MARLLLLESDACLWNVLSEVLESQGYTVCLAHNDYEGLPLPCSGCRALPTRPVQYVVLF